MDKIETTHAGSRRHSFVGKKGDLRCELHYMDLATQSMALMRRHAHCGREACLYIYKANAPRNGVLLPMCQMWEFTPFTANELSQITESRFDAEAMGDRLNENARRMAKQLYGLETESDCNRVIDLLCDYIEDLKNHPPETGLDKTLDEFLAEVDEETEGGSFFLEINGEKVSL